MLANRGSTVLSFILLLPIVLLGACDATIDPYSDHFSYSVYGFLSPSRSIQFIRVKPLDRSFAPDTSRTLDVTVTLENRSTGVTETLRDSVIVFHDANTQAVTHNFWTDTPIRHDTRYRLTLDGPDGATVQSTTTTLPEIEPVAHPSRGACDTLFTVELPGIDHDGQIRRASVVFEGTGSVALHPSSFHSATENRDAYVVFRPSALTDHLGPEERELSCSDLRSTRATIRLSYFSEIPPEEAELLDPTRPLELPVVQNGRGFFGALGRSRTTVRLDTSSSGPSLLRERN